MYLIADPYQRWCHVLTYQRRCHVLTEPADGQYQVETVLVFGLDVDLSKTPVGLVLDTSEFPVD